MRPLFHLLVLALAALPAALAGGVDSGGGMAIVCRDQGGKIESAEVLDLWEGQMGIYAGGTRVPPANSKDYRGQIKDLDRKIGSRQDFNLELLTDEILKSVTFLSAGQRLELSEDALPVLLPPTGCQFEQAAVFNVRLQRFYFSSDIWNAMSETNRAALVVHEALYLKLRREAGEKDSLYTRQVISHLFANEEADGPHDRLRGEVYSCSAQERGSNRALTHFYLFQEGSGQLKLQPTQVKNVPLFARDVHNLAPQPGYPSLEELASGLSGKGNWALLIGGNSPATTGWIMDLWHYKGENSHWFSLWIAFRRPGEKSLPETSAEVKCTLKK